MYDIKFTGKRVVDGKTYLDIVKNGVTATISGPMAEAVKDYPLDALRLNVWSESIEISVYLYVDKKFSSKDYEPDGAEKNGAEGPKKAASAGSPDAETENPDGNESKGAA
jgi:hypothetical protein